LNAKNSPRVADADRRRDRRVRPFRRRRHGRADDLRRDRLEDAPALSVAARQRRLADAVRRSVDPQLRRQRPGLRRRARQADRQSPVEDVAASAVGSGVYDAAADSRRRTGPGGQRRRLSGRRLRSADRQGTLARQLQRWLLERAAPVYGHGLVYIATGFQQPTLLAVRRTAAAT
jgi:hypothetical protein